MTLDMVTFQHVHYLTIFEQGDARRRRRIGSQVFPGLRSSLHILTCKYGKEVIGTVIGSAKGKTDTGTSGTRSATTHRIHHEQSRSLGRGKGIFNLLSISEFYKTR